MPDQMTLFDGPKLKELIVAMVQTSEPVTMNNLPMMNGKRFDECTDEEFESMGRFLIDWGKAMRLNRMFPIIDRPAIGEVYNGENDEA